MAPKKRKSVKLKSLAKSAGKKAKNVKGGLPPSFKTDEGNQCCRTLCAHSHCAGRPD